MKIVKYWFLVLLLAPLGAQAAIVNFWFDPQDSGPINIGETTTLNIMTEFVDAPIYSGAVALNFNPNIVHISNVTVTIPANIDVDNGMPLDGSNATTGTVSPIGFTYMDWVTGAVNDAGIYQFATVELLAVGTGTSGLTFSELAFEDPNSYRFQWTNALEIMDPVTLNFEPGSVSVSAVPLPAAAWFMLSGLGFLAFRRRRT